MKFTEYDYPYILGVRADTWASWLLVPMTVAVAGFIMWVRVA